jgi:hypothetical protein
MKSIRCWLAAIPGVVVLTAAGTLCAQSLTILCEPGTAAEDAAAPCGLEISSRDTHLPVRVQVLNGHAPAANAVVVARAAGGTVFPDTVRTDGEGYARLMWMPASPGATGGLALEARTPTASEVRYITIAAATRTQYGLRLPRNGSNDWYAKHQLPAPVVVEVVALAGSSDTVGTPITSAEECTARRVAFRNLSPVGSVQPDTAQARVDRIRLGRRVLLRRNVPERTGCIVEMRWALGDGAGVREARATLLGSGTALRTRDVRATARPLPRVVMGPGFTWREPQYFMKGTEVGTVDTLGGTQISTVIGIAGHARPAWGRVTPMIGMNLASPSTEWYVGASVPRLVSRGLDEIPIDINLLLRLTRRASLDDPAGCAIDPARCTTERRLRSGGVGVGVTIDASSLFSDALKKLAGL